MGFADLHIHSIYSYDGICQIETILDFAANETQLDVLAITDHDVVEGSLRAAELAPAYGLEAVPAVEVTAREGHILGLFVHKDIPRGLSALETVLRIGEQGGLAVAAHPMARGVHGLSAAALRNLVADPDARRVLVGLEAINAGLVLQGSNLKTGPLADELNLAQTGGSDSHVLFTVGQGITTFPGRTAADLRRALLERTTQAVKMDNLDLLRFLSIWLPGRVWRRVHWAPLHS